MVGDPARCRCRSRDPARPLIHWLSHFFGIDTQQSPYYDFWSGVATQGSILFAVIAGYRHHNCHKRFCLRLGHLDPETHLPVCRKHRPN